MGGDWRERWERWDLGDFWEREGGCCRWGVTVAWGLSSTFQSDALTPT